MLFRLLLLFITVPLIELVILLYIADRTTFTFTFALVILTGIAGSLLARSQGFQAYRRIREELAQGRMPAQAVLDAVLIFCAGALLLTPGILTDAFGLSILVPPIRAFYKSRMIRWFHKRFRVRTTPFHRGPTGTTSSQVIDSYVVDRPDEERRKAGG